MEKISALTEQISNMSKLEDVDKLYNYGVVDLQVKGGTALVFKVFGKSGGNGVAVVDVFLSEGSAFPPHEHEYSIEHLIIYSGHVEVICDGVTTELYPGNTIIFKKNVEHHVRAIKDSWGIAITVPADKKML